MAVAAIDLFRASCPVPGCTGNATADGPYETGVALKEDSAVADLSIHFAAAHAPPAVIRASISPSFLARLFRSRRKAESG